MTLSTRDQLLNAARGLFAERGFYGVSIANIADELGLTKQALLHHFSTKEKLYGEVLQRISHEIIALLRTAQTRSDDPVAQLKLVLAAIITNTPADAERARLLMRELLDNKRRADAASTWHLKPFLDGLVAIAKATPNWVSASDSQALALVYQLLGAISYYAVSEPTLRGILGEASLAALHQAFGPQLDALTDAALARPPSQRGG